jgi:hypothetical protein
MTKLKANLVIDVFLLGMCIIPSLWALSIDLNGSTEFWFQRSGSIMVIFAVLLEFNLFKYNSVEEAGTVYVEGQAVSKGGALPTFKKIIKVFGFILAILGTLIWGYGDLPFKA